MSKKKFFHSPDFLKSNFVDILKRINKFSTFFLKILLFISDNCLDLLMIINVFISGTVVTSDSKDIKFERVREEMCTPTLKGVVKIVLVQACQGDSLGMI